MVGGLSTMTITITVTYQHIKSHLQITSMYIRAWLQDTPVLHPNHTIPIHFNFHSQKKRCPMPLLVISLTKRHSASHFEWFTIFLTKHRHRLLARLIGLFHTMISQHHPQPHPYTFLLLWDTSGEVEALVTYPITDPISQLPDTHRFMSSHEGSNVQGTPASLLVIRRFYKMGVWKKLPSLRSQWCVINEWYGWMMDVMMDVFSYL